MVRTEESRVLEVYYCDDFELPLPPGHRFPISKYRLTRERITSELGSRLRLNPAPQASREDLARVHSEDYLDRALTGRLDDLQQRRIGFPWSPEMLERSRRSTGATLATAQAALRDGLAVHLSGGTHHAFADEGQGFCVFNDVAVAIRRLQSEQQIQRAVVIDCDVHQGNGTASIFNQDSSVFTFSMHGDRNYPFRKTQSDLDLALPDRTADAEYLQLLDNALQFQLPLADADIVFYIAGADPFVGDRMGRLNLTKQGLAQRDELVLATCRRRNLATAVVMGGGYAAVEDVVDIHSNTVRIACEIQTASKE